MDAAKLSVTIYIWCKGVGGGGVAPDAEATGGRAACADRVDDVVKGSLAESEVSE